MWGDVVNVWITRENTLLACMQVQHRVRTSSILRCTAMRRCTSGGTWGINEEPTKASDMSARCCIMYIGSVHGFNFGQKICGSGPLLHVARYAQYTPLWCSHNAIVERRDVLLHEQHGFSIMRGCAFTLRRIRPSAVVEYNTVSIVCNSEHTHAPSIVNAQCVMGSR